MPPISWNSVEKRSHEISLHKALTPLWAALGSYLSEWSLFATPGMSGTSMAHECPGQQVPRTYLRPDTWLVYKNREMNIPLVIPLAWTSFHSAAIFLFRWIWLVFYCLRKYRAPCTSSCFFSHLEKQKILGECRAFSDEDRRGKRKASPFLPKTVFPISPRWLRTRRLLLNWSVPSMPEIGYEGVQLGRGVGTMPCK